MLLGLFIPLLLTANAHVAFAPPTHPRVCLFFYPRQVKLASKRFLAGSLGIAAGVMLYVSLVEIFVKSQIAFAAHGYSDVSGLV